MLVSMEIQVGLILRLTSARVEGKVGKVYAKFPLNIVFRPIHMHFLKIWVVKGSGNLK